MNYYVMSGGWPATSESLVEPAAAYEFSAQSAYVAANDSHRRQRIPARPQIEDELLTRPQRAKLGENARDMIRNYAVAAWAVRCHLNYICAHRASVATKDDGFNREVEHWLAKRMQADRFDASKRFPGRRFVRLLEAQRVISGDVLVVRTSGGGLQGIEYDRVFTPIATAAGGSQAWRPLGKAERWIGGVRVTPALEHLGYAVHARRTGGAFEFEREVPVRDAFLFGYFDRFDQVRGVSPLAPGLNQLRDVAEAQLYALAKAKVSQFFALVMNRAVDDDDDEEDASLDIDLGGGPCQVDLNPGDEAKFLESATPSTQFQDFTKTVLQLALRALDIPISFFNESETNFYGSRGAWIHYQNAAEDKREGVRELLLWWTAWALLRAIVEGELVVPRRLSVEDVLAAVEWIPSASAWWNPTTELQGQMWAISAGLDNPQRICRENGTDVFANIDAIAAVLQYAKTAGVPLTFTPNLGPAATLEALAALEAQKGGA